MKKKIAKVLRDEAEKATIGKHPIWTRKLYRKLKKEHKEKTKVVAHPKFKLSKRQQRLSA